MVLFCHRERERERESERLIAGGRKKGMKEKRKKKERV